MKEGDGSLVCSNAAVGEERSPGLCDVVLNHGLCHLYTSPSPRDATLSRMQSSA